MIYHRRRPFDRQKLDYALSKWPRNIIRCKGIMWFEDEPDMAWLFETSGRQIQASGTGKWIASAPQQEMDELLEQNPHIAADWDETYGDRMIKLCIIGKDLDREKIAKDLDVCLGR